MQIVLLVSVLVVAASAAPPIGLLARSEVGTPSGDYQSSYHTENGIKSMESGRLIPSDDGKDMTLVKEGVISYPTPDGTIITTSYIADETGYHPQGEHLPKSVLAMPTSFV